MPAPAFPPVLSAFESLSCNLQMSIDTGLWLFVNTFFTVFIFIHSSFFDVGFGNRVHPAGGLFCDQINRLSKLPGLTLLGLIHLIS